MGKYTIIYNDIIELNHRLDDLGLRFKLHLHDACGSQSVTIEALSNCSCVGHEEEMKNVINEYFKEKRVQIRYSDDNLEFVISI